MGFTITLGYNRRLMAAPATDQKLGTLLRMHEAAFAEWGAVPEGILCVIIRGPPFSRFSRGPEALLACMDNVNSQTS
jgi:hypothetical protein